MFNIRIGKRAIALALTIIMSAGMVACGGSEDDDSGSGTISSATDDSVVDMGGYEFTMQVHIYWMSRISAR